MVQSIIGTAHRGVRVLAQLRQVGEVEQVHGLGHAGEHAAQDRLLRDRAAGVRRRAVERLRLPHTRRLLRRAPVLPTAYTVCAGANDGELTRTLLLTCSGMGRYPGRRLWCWSGRDWHRPSSPSPGVQRPGEGLRSVRVLDHRVAHLDVVPAAQSE
jgi:hypothetical protein